MTDEQWSTLTTWLKVPSEARAAVENELDLYARVAAAGIAPRPSDVKSKLEHAAGLASKLLEAMEEFGLEEHDALCASQPVTVGSESDASELARLVGRSRATPRREALKLLAEQQAQLLSIRDGLTIAAGTVVRGKTRDASNARALVRRVSEIVEAHTGKPLSRGSKELDFARKFGELADPPISFSSVNEAVKTLAPKLASENSANSG